MRATLVVFLALAPVVAPADEVLLRGGRRIEGVVVERTPQRVVIEVGPGRLTFAAERVEGVLQTPSALAEWRRRAEILSPTDLTGWLDLGLWCREQGLETQAREALERVVVLDPANAVAQAALGNVLHQGRWLAPADAMRARGLVQLDGRWMSPAEREDALRERAEERAAARARAESEARVREAEARAAAAEAAARQAEAARDSWPYGYGYGPYYGGFVTRGHGLVGGRGRTPPTHGSRPQPEPPLRLPTSSLGPLHEPR